jgi:glycosyltransferase involved in cell wall biosynthesis
MDGRGVSLLLDVAEYLPQVRFRLCWRPWGNAYENVRAQIQQRSLENIELVRGTFSDMASQYRRCHITVAPFTDMSFCKPMPNSLIESLACGRPVVATEIVGLADVIRHERSGQVCPATVQKLAEAIERVGSDLIEYGKNARQLAEKWFSERQFVEGYRGAYQSVLGRST